MDIEKIRQLAVLLDIPEERLEALLEAVGEEEHPYYNPVLLYCLGSINWPRKFLVGASRIKTCIFQKFQKISIYQR